MAEKETKTVSKFEKIATWSIAAVSAIAIGTVGVMDYLADQDSMQTASVIEARNYCLSQAHKTSELAEKNRDVTMEFLLREGRLCISENPSVLKREARLLGTYIVNTYLKNNQ